MRCIHQKLHSKRGVSAIIALVFLLFCATVGAIVLTAASANAGKSTRVQKEQQAYFAVRSAAQLVRDELEGAVFCGTFEEIIECSEDRAGAESYVQVPHVQYPENKNHWSKNLENTANAWMKADAEGIFKLSVGNLTSYELKAQPFEVKIAQENVPAIKGTYQMDQTYGVKFTFETSSGTTSVQKATLTLSADVKTNVTNQRETWYKPDTQTVTDPLTGEETEKVVQVPQYAIIQRTETTVTWNRGVLTKGIDDTSDESEVLNP